LSYFELLPPTPAGPIELKALKDPRPLLALMEAKLAKALSKPIGKETWLIETRQSRELLIFLAQKQALLLSGKVLYPDPFNLADLLHTLTYDGSWHIELDFLIQEKKIPVKQTLFHSLGRWLIHKNFIYLWSDEIDKRALENHVELEDSLCQKWLQNSSSYPYASTLHFDESCQLFEAKKIQPLLRWNDYAWSRATLHGLPQQLSILQKDLQDLGATVKKLPNNEIAVSWSHSEKLYEAMEFLLESDWLIEGPKQERLHRLEPLHIEKVASVEGEIEIQAYTKPKSSQLNSHVITGGALSHYLKKSAKYLPLDDRTWLLLPHPNQCKELIHGKSYGDKFRLEPWRLETLQHLPEKALDNTLKAWKNLQSLKDPLEDPLENLSEFAFELRPYQKQGLQWLIQLTCAGSGGLLADEMGLGKTIQTLAFLLWHQAQTKQGHYLIVTPRSLLQTWKQQITKAFAGSASLYLHHGQERARQIEALKASNFTLTTYQTLRQDLSLLSAYPWDVAVFDECHLCRNPQTQGYHSLKTLQAKMKLGLSGTPIYNSLDDLWHQLRLFAPSLIQAEKIPSSDILWELRPLWLRRTKEQVAPDLPEKIEETLWLEMDDEQEALYHNLLHTSLKEKEGEQPSTFQILEKILRLRQCCLWPALVSPGSGLQGVKAEQLLLDLETLISEKQSILVFSQFSGVLNPMYTLAKASYCCYYVDSHTKDRDDVLKAFEQGGPSVLFMTLGTGSVGLNLTKASAVILLDPWWNESLENQAIDRTHRIGQTQTVLVRRYMVKDSLEEAMAKLKETKKNLTQAWESGSHDSPIELELWQKLQPF
jgi:superfamily II DNA or RNA helicase